jgi:hypothetical protein
MEVRKAPSGQAPAIKTYGTIDGGLELMQIAWARLRQIFAVRHQQQPVEEGGSDCGGVKVYLGSHRERPLLLTMHPVDLLVVERGHIRKPPQKYQPSQWATMVANTPRNKRPVVVVEMWVPYAQLWTCGPMSKHDTSS